MAGRQEIADALATEARRLSPDQKILASEVTLIDQLAASLFGHSTGLATAPGGPAQPVSAALLTARVALEIVGHEAIVPEAYKDSVEVWTWGVGVTAASGHDVMRYKDQPQPIQKCLEIYIWLLRQNYIPAVVAAFAGYSLTEAQFAAAVSFHYNTGAIGTASWVASWKAGDVGAARSKILNWNKPKEIIGRRTAERDLFFDGKWSQDGKVTVYPVAKPSYSPAWGKAQRVDIRADMDKALAS